MPGRLTSQVGAPLVVLLLALGQIHFKPIEGVMQARRRAQAGDFRLQSPQLPAQHGGLGLQGKHTCGGPGLLRAEMDDRYRESRYEDKNHTRTASRQRRLSAVRPGSGAGSLMRTPSRMTCGFENLSLFSSKISCQRRASPSCSRAIPTYLSPVLI